ncbi:uncharacterized protein BO88DRAFT_439885 [Aspergillus vadensis CBS 113365]|uniref:Uncharacterized protein n=1 Tax=Aspergillus vadensis (strain CBS 113365 / IMI 142717 / IBT 24658) TaxID=1448311 RepID=A0A319C7I8_ASPVC|nr:hypothetical protein BO88DRAFT_439885 [Aspergillus vadensis CBS 113365]PYH74403.1 hypothetical protein BO88DRAFT_439885 [Aspergillus vadensis CBS 113365]
MISAPADPTLKMTSTVISDTYTILTGLPASYQLRPFPSWKELRNAVQAIYNQLEQHNWSGNQWIALTDMSQAAIDKLNEDHDLLAGISVRFTWMGTTGLLKVAAGAPHHFPTTEIVRYIDSQCSEMGVPRTQLTWGMAVTLPDSAASPQGKQPDACVFPPNRQPRGGKCDGWPSLVVETGVSESLTKLRRDATWWFQHSSGDTGSELRIEKWQLVPSGSPVTRHLIEELRQHPGLMPPLGQLPAGVQTAFCVQEVVITPQSIMGQPLVIPFRALFDQKPNGAE